MSEVKTAPPQPSIEALRDEMLAIEKIVILLSGLSQESRAGVIEYVTRHLRLSGYGY